MEAELPIPHPSDWALTRLGDIAVKIGSGATPLGGGEAYLPTRSRFALVRSQNVFDRHFETAGLVFISDEQAQLLRSASLQPGDLLLNITGDGVTFSRACAVPPEILPACVNQHVAIIRVDTKRANAGFILSYLTHPRIKMYIESFNAGGSRRAITKGHIESFQLALPLLSEQRSIAEILGACDDKIELNRRMNETLEAIVRALFKSWFVNFDPVRAKTEGRDPGLPESLADLFPGSFEESEFGEIPRTWKFMTLGEITTYLNRGISPSYVNTGGILVLNQRCIRAGRVDISKGRRHDPGGRSVEGRLLERGDVLVNSTGVGTLGRVAQLLDLEERIIVDSHVTVVRANATDVSWNYLGLALSEREGEIEALGEGTTGQTELSRSRLASLLMIVPSRRLLEAFDETCVPFRRRLLISEKESRTLSTIRDTLLPKLISGELRIKDAERIVGAHT